MALPTDVEVALSLLQIIGLLIPVIFFAIQPYVSKESSLEGKQRWKTVVRTEIPLIDVDSVPDVMIGGLAVIAMLGLAAVFAAVRVILYLAGSWFVTASVVLLILGVLGLCLLAYLIRLEFKSDVEGV